MTEEEAKTKWCPQVQTGEYRPNPEGADFRHAFCLGSACMVWRVTKGDEEQLIDAIRRYRSEKGAPLKEAKEFVETHPEYRKGIPDGGYCGLGGRP